MGVSAHVFTEKAKTLSNCSAASKPCRWKVPVLPLQVKWNDVKSLVQNVNLGNITGAQKVSRRWVGVGVG